MMRAFGWLPRPDISWRRRSGVADGSLLDLAVRPYAAEALVGLANLSSQENCGGLGSLVLSETDAVGRNGLP